MFMPFNVALIFWASPLWQCQHAPSTMFPFTSMQYYIVISWPLTHQPPWRVFLTHFHHFIVDHALQGDITGFIIPLFGYCSGSSLQECSCCPKPTTYWKEAYELSTEREHITTRDISWSLQDLSIEACQSHPRLSNQAFLHIIESHWILEISPNQTCFLALETCTFAYEDVIFMYAKVASWITSCFECVYVLISLSLTITDCTFFLLSWIMAISRTRP